MIDHSEMYSGLSPAKIIHKKRIKKIFYELKKIESLQPVEKYADFGCSNGYILNLVRKAIFNNKNVEFYGFDNSHALLEQATQKNIPKCEFEFVDLNKVKCILSAPFDIITCFETIEHVGNYKNAFDNVYLSTKPEGIIFLSIPVETGLIGLLKFIGRMVLERQPYGNFFHEKTKLEYVLALLTGKNIERFRSEVATGWKEHLGFDYKKFEDFINSKYINTNKIRIIRSYTVSFGANKFYILKKSGAIQKKSV